MSNRSEDINVRIVADYQKALKDVQAFVGQAGKEFQALPKVVQQVGASLDALNAKITGLGKTQGPQALQGDLAQLPAVVRQLSQSVDTLTGKIDAMGRSDGPEKVRRKLGQTNEEATRLKRTFDSLVTGGKAVGAAMAGWAAGKMVLQPHIDRMLDYDTKLAHLANVAYADKSVAERIAGKEQLNSVITAAWRAGGGTREAALDAYQRIIGSGAVSDADARTMLPAVVRGATASGASNEQIGAIGVRAMQNFGFKATDLPRVIDMAIKSANDGGFEFKDMARHLPEQMAEAAMLGMKGEKGLAQLLALNQVAVTTAGSPDTAANNVLNFLSKINSSDTKNDFKKLGIDLTGRLSAAAGKGVDPMTAFAGLVDDIMKQDKAYTALQKKLAGAKGDKEKTDILEQQLRLTEGTAIGKVLQDRQARSAFLGFKMQSDAYQRQVGGMLSGSDGLGDKNFAVVSQSPEFMRQQALNEQLNAQNEALRKLNPALESYWQGMTKLGREHPLLTSAIEGGKIAVGTFAAGAGTASAVLMLLSRNGSAAAAALGGVAATGGGKTLTGGPYGSGMGWLGKLANLSIAGAVGWDIGTNVLNPWINEKVKSATGGKSDSLGGWLYDVTHDQPGTTTAVSSASFKRQLDDGAGTSETLRRAIRDSFDSQGQQKLQIGLTLGFDESMRPVVRQQSVSGREVDLSTGPMMTH